MSTENQNLMNNDDSSGAPSEAKPVATAPQKTFAELGAGDIVIVDSSRYGGENLSVARIYRTTATQIILRTVREGMDPLDSRYRKDNGHRIGTDSYSRERLMIPTPELMGRVEKQRLVARLSSIRWKDLHLDTLRAVSSAIKDVTSRKVIPPTQ